MPIRTNKTNVAVIGIRGIHCIYSGFETFANQLVKKIDKKTYSLHLYTRQGYEKRTHGTGYAVIPMWTIKNKYFETVLYALFSQLASVFRKIDIVLYLGLPSAFFSPFQKVLGRKVVVNVDGLDWRRKRWAQIGKWYLLLCKNIAVMFADEIITDSPEIFSYYKRSYPSKPISFIGYGAEVAMRSPGRILKQNGLLAGNYMHCVGRFTPENCFEQVISSYKKIVSDYKLVLVGDSVYEDAYKKKLCKLAENDDRIVFTGFLKGKEYEEVCSNSACYIEPKTEGGIHPSLVEAIAFKNRIIARDIKTNRYLLGDDALYFNTHEELMKALNTIVHKKKLNGKRSDGLNKTSAFSWEFVIKQYQDVFTKLLISHR